MQKINSIHFGLPWILISLLVGIVIPIIIKLFTGIFMWPFTLVGGIELIFFAITFIKDKKKDNGNVKHCKNNFSIKVPYNREKQIPVLKCSICTGERIAGFKDIETGHITEVLVIRSDEDLINYKKHYGIDSLKDEY